MAKNILFIMADQLRRDYLSCYGAQRLATPQIDSLAARGVRFTNAYVQGPVCGVSRMSYYTGRYMTSHGANWNFVPLPLHNLTLGDHLRPLGLRVAVVTLPPCPIRGGNGRTASSGWGSLLKGRWTTRASSRVRGCE